MAVPTFRWQNTSSSYEAPDISKPGSIMAKQLQNIVGAAADYRQGKQNVAVDAFKNEVRTSDDFNQLGAMDYSRVNELGVSAEQIAALEAQVLGKQKDISTNNVNNSLYAAKDLNAIDEISRRNFDSVSSVEDKKALDAQMNEQRIRNIGQTNASAYDSNLRDNRDAIQDAFASNLAFADTITLDQGGNASFFKDASKPTQAELKNKNAYTQTLQQNAAFVPVKSQKEETQRVRELGQMYGFTKEQETKLIAQNNAHRKEQSTLNDEQLSMVAAQDANIDRNTESAIAALPIKMQKEAQELGYTSPQANQILQTSLTDLQEYVESRVGKSTSGFSLNPFSWLSNEEGGVDVKKAVNKLQSDNPKAEPWMILKALQQTSNVEEGNVETTDFDAALIKVMADTDDINRLKTASQLDATKDFRIQQITQLGADQKAQNLAQFKGSEGIQNTRRNTKIFRQELAAAVASGAITEADADKIVSNTDGATATGTATGTGTSGSTVTANSNNAVAENNVAFGDFYGQGQKGGLVSGLVDSFSSDASSNDTSTVASDVDDTNAVDSSPLYSNISSPSAFKYDKSKVNLPNQNPATGYQPKRFLGKDININDRLESGLSAVGSGINAVQNGAKSLVDMTTDGLEKYLTNIQSSSENPYSRGKMNSTENADIERQLQEQQKAQSANPLPKDIPKIEKIDDEISQLMSSQPPSTNQLPVDVAVDIYKLEIAKIELMNLAPTQKADLISRYEEIMKRTIRRAST